MNLPKVSIVIPTLRNKTKPYLDLCIDSIRNLDYPKDLLDISIVSPTTYIPKYAGVNNLHHPRDDRNFAEAVNYGIVNSDKSSKHVLLLSDDTIITSGALKTIVEATGDNEMLMQGISNCDNGWLYNLLLPIKIRDQRFLLEHRFYKIEDLGDDCRYLKDSNSIYAPGIMYFQTLCFYAVLIPRSVIAKVGLLDEKFQTGYEDSDYCHRVKQANMPLGVCLNAVIFHAGGATTNDTNTPEIAEMNKKYFYEKWKT